MAIKLENYDKAIKELAEIVNSLEKEQLSLEKSIDLYKKGIKLHKELTDILQKEEGKLFVYQENVDDEVDDKEKENNFVEKSVSSGQMNLEL
ncbi:hypothetical protein HMPREF3188_01515 [Tissierellia bacterium KA00581]|nr:hypothetical protein HMPREF3188_01515 [Tissierellia bacterium KA00581]